MAGMNWITIGQVEKLYRLMSIQTKSFCLEVNQYIGDPSLILPGEGVEDIWEGEPKFCTLRGRGMKNKEHFKRRTMEFLLKSWSGDQNIYINLRAGTKIPSNI